MLRFLKAGAQFVWELVKVALVSLAIILPVRYYLVQPFYVKGASMEPNYVEHDYLLIDEISYRFRQPARGEVVVLRYPNDPSQFFIKRVVGLPGERLVVRDGHVWIGHPPSSDLQEITEPYLTSSLKTLGNQDITLGSDQFFVMGDNRGASLDSRSFGPLPRRDIVGRTWVRAWPFDRWQVFSPAHEY